VDKGDVMNDGDDEAEDDDVVTVLVDIDVVGDDMDLTRTGVRSRCSTGTSTYFWGV
jgi:hypothetical protein